MTDETYFGDGLYAPFDDGQIWLRAPREGGKLYWCGVRLPMARKQGESA